MEGPLDRNCGFREKLIDFLEVMPDVKFSIIVNFSKGLPNEKVTHNMRVFQNYLEGPLY